MNGHRSGIKHNRNKRIAKHFNKPDHTLENIRLAVIKKVKGLISSSSHQKSQTIKKIKVTKQQREVKEQKIIFKFDCVNIDLNRDYSVMSHYM